MMKFLISIFYIFVHNRSFLEILPNFNLLQTLELTVLTPLFFSRINYTAAINFPCSKSWLGIFENDVIFSKILCELK